MPLVGRMQANARETFFPGHWNRRTLAGFRDSAVDERIGEDKRPIFRTSLVIGNPDLARGSDVFYYFSAGFLTV